MAFVLLLLSIHSANAVQPCWMVLAIDVSPSINDEEEELQRFAYAEAFSRAELLEAMDGCKVRVVEWAGEVDVVTTWIEPAALPAIYTEVKDRAKGATSPVRMILKVVSLMVHVEGRKLINVTTDGIENVHKSGIEIARIAALSANIEVNVLVIDPPDVSQADLWWAHTLATGFVMPAASAVDIADSIWKKLKLELASIDRSVSDVSRD